MMPKRKQIQEGLTRLELWLDQQSLLLAAMRMTFPSGDTKLMTFADVSAERADRTGDLLESYRRRRHPASAEP